jgi:hypothetical protein
VRGHWQNGIAERSIGVIQNVARTILLQAMSLWPAVMNESFWPFAIRHAVNVYNHTVRSGAAASPWELFTGETSTRKLVDWHVFGSPVYVLHKSLQDASGSRHKWQSCCWQGVYLGQSPMHASNVALVYNPATTHVTPQFHVTYDDTFSSVAISTPEAADSIIDSLLEKTAWLYSDTYGPPSVLHYFLSPTDVPSGAPLPDLVANLAVDGVPSSNQAYKPVRASQAFEEWKQTNGIAAEVFAPVPQPGPLSGSSEGASLGTPVPQPPTSRASEGAPWDTPSNL